MEEFTGSVISMSSQRNKEESKENEDPNNTAPEDPPGFLERITSFFSFGSNKNEEDKNDELDKWEEFPWEDIMIKTDVIKKWDKVDMRYIQYLHANFDIETAKFPNLATDGKSEEDDSDEIRMANSS